MGGGGKCKWELSGRSCLQTAADDNVGKREGGGGMREDEWHAQLHKPLKDVQVV